MQHLVVDTSLFSATFQSKLLSALSAELSDGLDKHINGILIHSDNFGALNLLQARYREQVKCIYIDPPYNTGEDGFIYKDSYQHSSWLSMFENRLHLAYPLLTSDGNQFCSIDDVEEENAKLIFNSIFKKENFEAIIWKKKGGAGNTEKILGCLTEYILCYFKNKTAGVFNYRSVERNYAYKDEIGFYNLEGIEKTNLGAYERPTMLFDIIDPETNIAFRPSENNRWTIGYKTIYGDENSNTVGYIKQNRLYFDYKTNKVYLIKRPEHYENSENVYYNLLLEHGSLSVAKDEIKKLVGNREIFSTPKPVNLITTLLEIATKPNSTILDYFAGSGTTAHAVINLNREDNGKRQYILVEQGEYFDTVLKPRVQKVIYSKAWKDGKPVVETGADNLQGVPQIVKVLKLESYEDTLNNLELRRSDLFDQLPKSAQHDYLLHYMLDIESRDSLLNVSHFAKPFDYQLKITTNSAGEFDKKTIDLVETFNYLIGATVIGIDDKRDEQGFVAVECHLPNQHTDEKTLIFWRDCERIGYDELQKQFDRLRISPADSEYSQVYVNGDHTLETVWDGEQSGSLKIRSIEAEFLALMFVGDE